MRRIMALVATLSLAPAWSAWAGDVAFTAVTPKGRPAAEAVVAACADGPRPGPIRFPWPAEMNQHNLRFVPFVLIVVASNAGREAAQIDVRGAPDRRGAY